MQKTWNEPIVFSQIGHSHVRENGICEDAYSIGRLEDGDWLAITVCDGAGSALYGEQGAKIVSTNFNNGLLKIASEINYRIPDTWINDAILKLVLEVRKIIRDQSSDSGMENFHTTLVSTLLNQKYGFSIHIGDGSIFGGNFENNMVGTCVDKNYFVSEPSNGEYANETYFITESRWIKNIHIKPFQNLDWLILGTDGGCEAIINQKGELKGDFVPTLFEIISTKPNSTHEKYLTNLLDSPEYVNITSDDRTVVLLTKNQLSHYDNFYIGNKIKLNDNKKKEQEHQDILLEINSTKSTQNITKEKEINEIYILKIILSILCIVIIIFALFNHFDYLSINYSEQTQLTEQRKNKPLAEYQKVKKSSEITKDPQDGM